MADIQEHYIVAESEPKVITMNILVEVTVTCKCGKKFTGRGHAPNALGKAEAEFRKHIPIRR